MIYWQGVQICKVQMAANALLLSGIIYVYSYNLFSSVFAFNNFFN